MNSTDASNFTFHYRVIDDLRENGLKSSFPRSEQVGIKKFQNTLSAFELVSICFVKMIFCINPICLDENV